jgi:hypothetical protein
LFGTSMMASLRGVSAAHLAGISPWFIWPLSFRSV